MPAQSNDQRAATAEVLAPGRRSSARLSYHNNSGHLRKSAIPVSNEVDPAESLTETSGSLGSFTVPGDSGPAANSWPFKITVVITERLEPTATKK